MSQYEVSEQADATQISQRQTLNITLLASEWKSSAGGLSTLNREFAIHLSKIQNVSVSLLVPEGACNDEDKRETRSLGIGILEARKCVGLDPLVWLSNPPQDHKIDVIVGHGVKLGCQVQLIKRQAQFQNCKWVHVVHTAPEDLSKYKGYSSPISRGGKKHEDEVDLCKCADLVVPVGPKLGKAYRSYLQLSKKDEDFFELIPGLFEHEFGDLPAKQNSKGDKDDFIVLLCGRGDEEDFELKGYNNAVKAFTDQRLKGKHYSLLFVGSPKEKQDEVRERLLNCGIDKKQLTVREFVKSREKMKDLFCEVDMVIMPSKSEGFGLVALEALSAGLPILVGKNSGFARAIEDIPLGLYSIVDSEDPAKWAKGVERVRVRHKVVLQESKILKDHYTKNYCWKKQCEEFVDKLWKMVYGTSTAQAEAADDWMEKQPRAIPESFCPPDQRTFQQHMEEGASTSWSQNAKKLHKRRISESKAEHADHEDAEPVEPMNKKVKEAKKRFKGVSRKKTDKENTENKSKLRYAFHEEHIQPILNGQRKEGFTPREPLISTGNNETPPPHAITKTPPPLQIRNVHPQQNKGEDASLPEDDSPYDLSETSPPTAAQSHNRRRNEDWESFSSHLTTEFEALKGEVEILRAEVQQLKREAKARRGNDDEPQEGTKEHLMKVVANTTSAFEGLRTSEEALRVSSLERSTPVAGGSRAAPKKQQRIEPYLLSDGSKNTRFRRQMSTNGSGSNKENCGSSSKEIQISD